MTGSAASRVAKPGAVQACVNTTCLRPCQGQGMSAQTQVDAYAKGVATLQADWGRLRTPAQRKERLQSLVDKQAAAAGFPPPEVTTPTDLGTGRNGELRFSDWQVAVNPSLTSASVLSPAQATALGDTLYHETRHAEQWYLMARRQAAEQHDAKEIQTQLKVPRFITSQAVATPLAKADARRACADAMYNSVYGASATGRNTTLTNLGPHSEAARGASVAYKQALADRDRAQKQMAADQKSMALLKSRMPPASAEELEAASARFQLASQKLLAAQAASAAAYDKAKATYDTYQITYAAYRALPEEADAWNAGSRAATAVNSALSAHAEPRMP